MEIGILTYLLLCPLMFIGGFVDAIAGGGGLITLSSYLACGLPSSSAVATNKISASMGTTISTTAYAKQGYIKLKPAILVSLLTLISSMGGAYLNLYLSEDILKIVLIIVIPITAVFSFLVKNCL